MFSSLAPFDYSSKYQEIFIFLLAMTEKHSKVSIAHH